MYQCFNSDSAVSLVMAAFRAASSSASRIAQTLSGRLHQQQVGLATSSVMVVKYKHIGTISKSDMG